MFIGHFAVGFAAKRAAPKSSLGVLIAAPIFLDMLWPIFLLLGWESVRIVPGDTPFLRLEFLHYPISHSLLTSIGWGLLCALAYWTLTRYRTGAIVVGVGVVSHWILDAVVHRPDLPLYPGSRTLVGLGLWHSVLGTVLVEGAMFVAGVWAYVSFTRPRDRVGRYALWALVLLLGVLYLSDLRSPPPPDVRTLALVALTGWLLPLWAWWIDRHRVVRAEPLAPRTFA
jgi:membrane-bound metal-dependent hydrolase YbcI (DUF457 family)